MELDNEEMYMTTAETETVFDTVSEVITESSEGEIYAQVSELSESVSAIADSTAEISRHMQIQTVLLFAIICVIGMVAGLLGALTWRSNIK